MTDVELNNSNESANNYPEEDAIEEVLEPPVKKKRGKALVYVFKEDVETWNELKSKAKVVGLKFIKTREQVSYFTCIADDCLYKWKAALNEELKYSIHETDDGHSHGERRWNGLPQHIKNIINQRITGNESTNPEAILQACRNNGIRILPTFQQIKNYVAYAKKHIGPNVGDLSFDDIQQSVKALLDDEPDLMEFKYIINADSSKSDF